MVHIFLLLFGVGWGIVICVLLFSASMKTGKGMWLVTVLGILIIAALAIAFTGHMLHLPYPILPYQRQIVGAVRWIPLVTVPLLLLTRLYELWSKKRKLLNPKT